MMEYEIKELGVGGILDQTLNLIKNNFSKLLALTVVPSIAVVALLVPLGLTDGISGLFFDSQDMGSSFPVSLILLFIVGGLLLLFVFLVMFGAVAIFTARRYLGKTTGIWSALRAAVKRVLPLGWTLFLYVLIIGLIMGVAVFVVSTVLAMMPESGIGFAIASVIGVVAIGLLSYLYLAWGIVGNVVILERVSGWKALKRSAFLMKKNKWKLFAITLIAFIVVAMVEMVGIVLSFPVAALIADAFAQLLSFVLTGVATTILYFSARCQKESFDLVMLANAMDEPAAQPGQMNSPLSE